MAILTFLAGMIEEQAVLAETPKPCMLPCRSLSKLQKHEN